MAFICLHDKQVIEKYLEKEPYLHIYGLGDLDDFLWPYTTWYGARRGEDLHALVYVYAGPEIPTVLALSTDCETEGELLKSIVHLLPCRFYAHLSPGLEELFQADYICESAKAHYKMALFEPKKTSSGAVIPLTPEDRSDLEMLYSKSYPGNWFDPRMLSTRQYFGIKEKGKLICAAGVHVFSPRYRVAAIGNITTLPEYRSRGYGELVTAALCKSLADLGLRIGLNVQADNEAAIACYNKIGFRIAAEYGEFTLQRKQMMTR